MKSTDYHIALVGNPNSGKTSLFNNLTGLRQKVGNYPGVTVDKKQGYIKSGSGRKILLSDLPGTYSLYPNSEEELIVSSIFANPDSKWRPDALIYVCDITSIKPQLLLFTQILDLKLPTILVLNMGDEAKRKGIDVDIKLLEEKFQVPCLIVDSRSREGYPELMALIQDIPHQASSSRKSFYSISENIKPLIELVQSELKIGNPYQALLIGNHIQSFSFVKTSSVELINAEIASLDFVPLKHQIEETLQRFDTFESLLKKAVHVKSNFTPRGLTQKLDSILTHKVIGPIIFILITLFIFESIYSWSEYPMSTIENGFSYASVWLNQHLPDSWYTSLLTEGILAGISGVLIFIPQIAILFFLITLLEEFGYMARAVYMSDRLMQAFGLNGRSIIALISGGACAIPAIMSARTISNLKERLITIMVTPLISCSARLPVYVILVGIAIPQKQVFGFFNLQGIVFTGLYLLGIVGAFVSAFVFHKFLKVKGSSFLALELPQYRPPLLRNVVFTVYEKVKSFVVEAGKIIFFISIVLWLLSSFGMPGSLKKATDVASSEAIELQLNESQKENYLASKKLEASFAGNIGKFMEPAIEPLGYDWKIGIALLTSFAAREVFIGTMATMYSVGSDDTVALRQKMRDEINPKTGQAVFSIPTCLSLLMFYVFAMQCISTLAVVKRETHSWKWPIIQFSYMGLLAYLSAFIMYQFSSYFLS